MSRILVIRSGALGDLVFCMAAFAAIRRAQPQARIALLTRAPFAGFGRSMPWFDEVIVDPQPGSGDWRGWWQLRQAVRAFGPTLVYDLQGKRRQSILYALLGGPFGCDWSGAAPFCRYPRQWPPTAAMSFPDFLAAQLQRAGVTAFPAPDLGWLDGSLAELQVPDRAVLLIPGCAPGAAHKRWPHYGELAQGLAARGLTPVLIGTAADSEAIAAITAVAPGAVDWCGRTDLWQLGALARRAVGVIGNDTGPVHLAAAAGARTLALFSGRSSPVWSRPPGARVAVLQEENLSALGVGRVLGAFEALVDGAQQERRQRESRP